MKKFIRPILFGAARLGLFCVVVTWIAAQSSGGSLYVPLGLREFLIEVHPRGYVFMCWDAVPIGAAGLIGPLSVDRYSKPISGPMYSDMFADEPREGMVTFAVNVPGVVAGRFQDMVSFVTLSHWFMVAVCVVFYGMLKWVYRKRAEASGTLSSAQQDQ